jgi:hypothetical protein
LFLLKIIYFLFFADHLDDVVKLGGKVVGKAALGFPLPSALGREYFYVGKGLISSNRWRSRSPPYRRSAGRRRRRRK